MITIKIVLVKEVLKRYLMLNHLGDQKSCSYNNEDNQILSMEI